jgi:D-alanyl-lipoteichoic acid acyltransferase DltB (MBOAT superfamily)
MLFNSYAFIFAFLPIALIGYFVINSTRHYTLGKYWLLAASLYFYTYFSFKNLPILALSILTNFFLSTLFHRELTWISKKTLFRFGLVFNIGLLCFYKYSGFLLPLGLSFFTLQQVAFLVDSYEGLSEKKDFLDYAVFVAFFPTLISGPMVHNQKLIPQIEDKTNKHFSMNSLSIGLFLFCLGLTKKVLLSEAFAGWAKPGFDEALSLDFFAAWKASLSYTFQIYFDFSGYSDMAIGLGRMLNVQLPQNFNSPFKSKSIIEFWTRWHITLSQFINTYLFTPIVRSMPKINFRNTMIATFLSMFIAGVWHGAGWTFVLYGALHGLALVVNHLWKKRKKKLPSWLAWLITFHFANVAFVIFRAKSLDDSFKVLKGMVGASGVIVPKIGIKSVGILKDYGFKMGGYLLPDDYFFLLLMLGCFVAIFKVKNSLELEKGFHPTTKIAMACALSFVLCLFGMNKITEFIYFNF